MDGQGRPVPRGVIHHMIMVNFSRRMLLYSAPERLLGAGTETEDIKVPKTIGVPMKPGMDLGMYVAWHNDTGEDLHGVQMKLRMLWTPKNQNPPPVNSLPIYMDVNLTVGAQQHVRRAARKVGEVARVHSPGRRPPAGRRRAPARLRRAGAAGGRGDRQGADRRQATRDSAGKVSKVSRKLFGVSGEGLKLKGNHRYRVVGEYDNPTGETLVKGAMAHMAGLFTPDDMSQLARDQSRPTRTTSATWPRCRRGAREAAVTSMEPPNSTAGTAAMARAKRTASTSRRACLGAGSPHSAPR